MILGQQSRLGFLPLIAAGAQFATESATIKVNQPPTVVTSFNNGWWIVGAVAAVAVLGGAGFLAYRSTK